jgi:hypothetical protein
MLLRDITVVLPPVRPPTRTADLTPSSINEHQDRCSDSDDDNGNWLGGDITDHVDLADAKSNEFDVGKHIVISSTYILDILSDHPVQPTAARGGPLIPKVVADQVATLSSTQMEDEREEWS